VLDWYSRYIISGALSQTLEMDFVLAAVNNALFQAKPEIWNACNANRSKSAWMDVDVPEITSSPKDCGEPSSTKKYTCMTMPAQRRLIAG